MGNPPPVRFHGELVSQDLANTSLEVSALQRLVPGMSPTSILEIGAGYGRVAYALLSLYPGSRYTIIDIEPTLGIGQRYLTRLFPDRDIRFLTPDRADEISDASVDLALSISSLHEMTRDKIAYYIALLDRVAGGGAVYLKQWTSWHNPKDDITVSFNDYVVPASWKRVFRAQAPVQVSFTHAGWNVGRTGS